MSLLEVRDMNVTFHTRDGDVLAVQDLSFQLEKGRTLGIVGESGCGKSVANMSILGLTRSERTEITGEVFFDGQELVAMPEDELRTIRGRRIAMIFQDPLTSLHPFFKIGDQLVEAIRVHRPLGDRQARERCIELLELVRIPKARDRMNTYPHQLSGGMRQRVMIAMALANDPDLLIADEPTTALDVTTQAQILDLLEDLKDELGMALIMITHDLGVIAEVADEVAVMYAGRIVESATVDEIFHDPQHPYTWGLLGSITRIDRASSSRLAQIAGQPPSLLNPPPGCPFQARCPHRFDQCAELPPLEARVAHDHLDRCWLEPDQKRELRTVDGRIGLEAKAEAEAAS